MMQGIKLWWAEANSRDQLAVLVLGICVLVFALFQFILFPMVDAKNNQQQRVVAQQAAYERVKTLATRWKNRNSNNGSAASVNVERVVEASFAQYGLRVSGFDASGRSGIRVRIDSVKYQDFIAWLYDIELKRGIVLKDVNVAGSSDPGLVSASVLIQK